MTRPTYRNAIYWLAMNDDCEWTKEKTGANSVASSLVADMFGKTDEQVKKDLVKEIKRCQE